MLIGPDIIKLSLLNPRELKKCIYGHITSVTFSTEERNVNKEMDLIPIEMFTPGAHTGQVSNIRVPS